MSRERAERRLDTMLAALRDPPVSLDEVAQARIQARLEAAIEHAADVAALRVLGGRRRDVVVAGAGIAAAIAAAAVFVVVIAPRSDKPGDGERTIAGQRARSGSAAAPATGGATAGGAAAGEAAAPVAAADRSARGGAAGAGAAGPGSVARDPAGDDAVAGAAVGREATAGGSTDSADGADGPATSATAADTAPTLIRVAAGASAEVTIEGAVVTVYGPGWLSPRRGGAVVDAAGITVNRTRGDTPWEMRYHDARIVVTRAAFSARWSTETRVSVLRGEIELECPSNARMLPSGASATCGTVSRLRVETPRRAAAPQPEPAPLLPLEAPLPSPKAPATSQEPLPPWPAAPLPSPKASPAPVATDPYAVVESAMRRGDLDAAGKVLHAIVAAAPDSLDAATALLDLARLAVRRGDTTRALGYLDRLDHHPRSAAFAAATAHLRATLGRAAVVRPPSAP